MKEVFRITWIGNIMVFTKTDPGITIFIKCNEQELPEIMNISCPNECDVSEIRWFLSRLDSYLLHIRRSGNR